MTILALGARRVCSRAVGTCRRGGERLYYRAVRRKSAACGDSVQKQCLPRGGEMGEIPCLYRALFHGSVEGRISRADRVCEHVFDLLGSGPTRLGPGGPHYHPLDWHRDFKSGYRWDPGAFFRDIRYGHIRGVDVKVPWELSRFQHLGALGQAYVLTGREKYRAEFTNQIDDWIAGNPVGFGVNWACTMDVAMRAANWLVGAEYILAGGGLDGQFLIRFYTSLHEHGRFIRGHLERYREGTTNHYLSDLVGLLFIAVYCPFFGESRRWRRFCIGELIREMNRQVYADGCHFEASTSYHRLVLELFFFATLLAATDAVGPDGDGGRRAAERVFGCEYMAKLHAMFAAVLHLTKPNGRMPQIGDNDSGRFLALGARDALDARGLLSLGAVFFNEPQFKVKEFGFAEETLWVFGRWGREAWERMEGRSVATIAGRAFPQAGWYVMRRHPDYCLVSCGPNGPDGRGGHAHNDKLSIELVLDGRDIVVDPGTCVYTSDPDRRNRFRATGRHNTVAVDDCEQVEFPDDLFRLPDRVGIARAELVETTERTAFEGTIEYAGIVHSRTVAVDMASGRWIVEDRLSSPHSRCGRAVFHLSPQVTSHGCRLLDKDTARTLAHIDTGDNLVETTDYDYSPEYGIAVKAHCIAVRIPDVTEAHVVAAFTRGPEANGEDVSRCEE